MDRGAGAGEDLCCSLADRFHSVGRRRPAEAAADPDGQVPGVAVFAERLSGSDRVGEQVAYGLHIVAVGAEPDHEVVIALAGGLGESGRVFHCHEHRGLCALFVERLAHAIERLKRRHSLRNWVHRLLAHNCFQLGKQHSQHHGNSHPDARYQRFVRQDEASHLTQRPAVLTAAG